MLENKYFEVIDTILKKVAEKQADKLVKAAEMIVDAALSGGRFWIYGWVVGEVTYRAGGLVMVKGLPDSSCSQLQEDDVVVLSAVRNNDPSDALFIEKAKAKGAKTIAIVPSNNPPDASRRLQDMVDLAIDDYTETGDGCLEVQGYASKICPTSGVVNAVIMWAVCAGVLDELRRRGKEAHVFKSVFRVGADEWNAEMFEEYERTGY